MYSKSWRELHPQTEEDRQEVGKARVIKLVKSLVSDKYLARLSLGNEN